MQTSSVSRSNATMPATNGPKRQLAFAAILNGVIENTEGYTWIIDKSLRYIVCNIHLRNLIKQFTGNETTPGSEVIDCIALLDNTQPLNWTSIYEAAFNDMPSRFTHHIIHFFITEYFFGGRRTVKDIAFHVGHGYNVGTVFDKRSEFQFTLPQCFFCSLSFGDILG